MNKTGSNNPMFGRFHSEETKSKMRVKAIGRKATYETRAKMRVKKLGTHHSEESKEKISKALSGKHLSEKHRAKLRDIHLGKHHSEETKAKIRELNKGSKNPIFGKTGEKSPTWKGDKAKPDAGRVRARKIYPCPKGFDHHHIDGNPLNNSPENILILAHVEHSKLHNHKAEISPP